jgi:hypothetical protein
MRLAALQHDFAAFVLRDGGTAPLVAEMGVPARATPEAMLGVYKDAYALRLLEALRNDFPALYRLLGEEVFDTLGREYIAAHPSRHFSVRWFGRHLAAFLAAQAPWRERPALADLAGFEWSLGLAFDAADADAAGEADFAALAPEQWDEMRLSFHPSLHRLALRTEADVYWQAHEEEAAPAEPALLPDGIAMLVWRQELTVRYRRLDADEAAALDAARSGESFGEICALLAEHGPEDDAPLRAAGFLRGWIESGLIAGVAVSKEG